VTGAFASIALWALLSSFSSRRPMRIGTAVAAAVALVVDAFVYRYYGIFLSPQVAASARQGWSDVRPIVLALLPAALLGVVAVACLEYAWLGSRPFPMTTRVKAACLAIAVAGFAATPASSLSPELRAVASWRAAAVRPLEVARSRATLPPLPSSRDEAPNILFVLTESVRAKNYCDDPKAPCIFSPEVNALFPERTSLRQMRSLASYTALSVDVLLTGRPLVGREEGGAELPSLFDYVHETRIGAARPFVAYWSAQAESVLHRDVHASVDSMITQETLFGHGFEDEDDAVELDPDGRLSERCVAELPKLPAPFFVMLHLLGTHVPYFVDPDRAPFQPIERVVTWGGLPRLENAYSDSILAQDRSIARCLSAFVARSGSHPWLILFTSDHGEAFGEHGGIHHGHSLYDDQIHVPAWVAHGNGALDASQATNLTLHEGAFVTHLDVLPTLLDALGVFRGLAMAPMRARLPGRSLLAPVARLEPTPATNCTRVFPCPLDTWGMLGDGHDAVAQPWDGGWNCVDLLTTQEHQEGRACEELAAASRAYFPTLPNGRANR
jgi:glucan phosphoethanolaminetransferase (alkaline phosphatase superfamily)